MKLYVQAGLFASAVGIAMDTSFRRAVRTALDATSWVELAPGPNKIGCTPFRRRPETPAPALV